jgi:hypothetical protein
LPPVIEIEGAEPFFEETRTSKNYIFTLIMLLAKKVALLDTCFWNQELIIFLKSGKIGKTMSSSV